MLIGGRRSPVVRRQKSLGLIGRFEPLDLSLSSSRGSMQIFGAVVQIPARPMMHIEQDNSLIAAMAARAVGDEESRLVS